MTPDQIITQLREQRTVRCEVEPGKTLLIRRPVEAQLQRLRGGITVELLADCITGWQGFTEADLLGASVGADDPAEFSAALCAEVLGDRAAWANAATEKLVEAVQIYLANRTAAAKN